MHESCLWLFDAVDWSLNGDYIVVATNSILRLLSSDLVELFTISLSFESVMDITDAYSVKGRFFPPRVF